MSSKFSFTKRLHDPSSFENALKKRGEANSFFSVHADLNGFGYERLGVIVSKRLVQKASKRNRVKRIVREVFRKSSADSSSSLDIVVRFRKTQFENQFVELEKALSVLLSKVRSRN